MREVMVMGNVSSHPFGHEVESITGTRGVRCTQCGQVWRSDQITALCHVVGGYDGEAGCPAALGRDDHRSTMALHLLQGCRDAVIAAIMAATDRADEEKRMRDPRVVAVYRQLRDALASLHRQAGDR